MNKIFVGNLSWKTTEDMLKTHFEAFGKVVSAKIVVDQMTNKSKGFGFVEMANAEDANKAIRELNGKMLLDRDLRISLAQERDPSEKRGERREREPRSDSYSGRSGNYRN